MTWLDFVTHWLPVLNTVAAAVLGALHVKNAAAIATGTTNVITTAITAAHDAGFGAGLAVVTKPDAASLTLQKNPISGPVLSKGPTP